MARLWTERVDVINPSVEIIASYGDGDLAGRAAITTLVTGAGSASYVSSDLDESGRAQEIRRVAEIAYIESELPEALRGEVELTIRTDGSADIGFLRNRSPRPVESRASPAHRP